MRSVLNASLLMCASTLAHADTYIVFNASGQATGALRDAGAEIVAELPQIGLIIAESGDPGFATTAAAIPGVSEVATDVEIDWLGPTEAVAVDSVPSPPFTGDDDFFFDLQWGHTAIRATEAWAQGYRGAGATVAVLDSGIDADHPDLAPNLNLALSTSFVPGEAFDVTAGLFNHGSHVSGTIAAADNAFGTIGVAPEAELIAVKVLSAFTGSGSFSQIIQGIVYAADVGADVINMSLGATIPRNCTFGATHFPASNCSALLNAIGRATLYARSQGVTIIASAGNSRRDFDHDKSLAEIPNDAPGVTVISATAPIGWATDPANTFLDNLASYSNFGQSRVDFAAPGGDFIYPGNEFCAVVLIRRCWVFDLVLSTSGTGTWYWSAGTSMAAPHASGVAALIIGKNGGDMHPAQVIAEMARGAVDLGKPGNDDAYGGGRVDALGAVSD